MSRIGLLVLVALVLSACGSAPRRGGYYQDDGPLPNPPSDLQSTPDAIPRVEPLRPANARPYSVLGRSYTPMTALAPYKERGLASWYGRKFHGSATASGETYDMYRMTGAHKTLPIPSYARVTNLRNGRNVIVRINDRGPFHAGRVIDLSYAAAVRLDKLQAGTVEVEVELLLPDEIARLQRPGRGEETGGREPAVSAVAATASDATLGATPIPAAAPAASTNAAATEGLFVQLGAFALRANALAMRDRVARELPEFGARTEVLPGESMFRVLVGPFDDPGTAALARDRLADALGRDAILVDRR